MSRTYLIIDGDNLLHAAGFARLRYGPGQLSLQRRRLLTELQQRLAHQVLNDAVVVFDGPAPVSERIAADRPLGMERMYSGAEHDADSVIERLLDVHSSPRQVIVVSSDHRLHKAAGRRKAGCVDADQFWEETEPSETSSGPPQGQTPAAEQDRPAAPGLTPEEVDEFLSIDIGEIRRNLRRDSH